MERVQFQQEQMLAELKDLMEKNLFTAKETKMIMKRRTEFETALVRRVAKKGDFVRYAAYEMGLEQLRRKRVERLKVESGPATVSDYALVRRQFHIFERALKRFKGDVGLWVQYIEVARREGARALVGRITARAIQMHPGEAGLYVIAAGHELEQGGMGAARTLLQRGLRLNKESVVLWREYVKMEVGFVESVRRRWEVLGIADEDEGRKEIMEGGIVKTVMESAVQGAEQRMQRPTEIDGNDDDAAVPRMEMFVALKEVVSDGVKDVFYGLLRATLGHDPGAAKMLAERFVHEGMTGIELVDGLGRANEEMVVSMGDGSGEEMGRAYIEFVRLWCSREIDEDLKTYLVGSLKAVARQEKATGALMAGHVSLLTGKAAIKAGRAYCRRAAGSADVWLAWLTAERRFGTASSAAAALAEVRTHVPGSVEVDYVTASVL